MYQTNQVWRCLRRGERSLNHHLNDVAVTFPPESCGAYPRVGRFNPIPANHHEIGDVISVASLW
jgi:hypothetical protein